MTGSSWTEHHLTSADNLNLRCCLGGGQAFTWIKCSETSWANIVGDIPVMLLQKDDGQVYYRFDSSIECDPAKVQRVLCSYFRLDANLQELYRTWSIDPYFAEQACRLPGIRLLRQDPVETLFAFICSQNNGISRIGSMVRKLKSEFGALICSVSGEDGEAQVDLYSFPKIETLAVDGTEQRLRSLGFGYRAKYIYRAALHLLMPENRSRFHSIAQEEASAITATLKQIPGVGPKVADCIALMAFDQLQIVPIDTHVWAIAAKHYRKSGSGKSLTPAVYAALGAGFREVFGEKAGWAHLILFASDLRPNKAAKRKL